MHGRHARELLDLAVKCPSHYPIPLTAMPRKPLLIFLLTLFLTVLQVQWAAPADGLDAETLSILSPEVLGAYPGVLLLFLQAALARRAMSVPRQMRLRRVPR